ncbi:alpha-amylase family glycosyl hydrolase [Pelagicoccus enzymogenes]|uniref:alpha-amylase family glycosyl hydrolase n=1 Tax=Pelagicoccus enzymogenes TaxID=2773457 RepID=UPI00280E6083|nr:alpha-amylase family glycosyl hydrolase [Pelagicoccus enzymogenes]MDQ8196673.1 alpha-amylase family glycosyl hydrolase [Pelagicoccus enzymogenes]
MSPTLESRHIRKAYLTSLTEGVVELNRDWRALRLPPISLEGQVHAHMALHALPPIDYAKRSGYYVSKSGKVVFVFVPQKYSKIEYTGVSVYVAGSFNGWQEAIGDEDWELKPESIGGKRVLILRKELEIFSSDQAYQFKFVTDKHHWFVPDEEAPNLAWDGMGNANYVYQPKRSGRHRLGFKLKKPIEFSNCNVLLYHTRKGVERTELSLGSFFLNLKSDKELGAVVCKNSVTFRLFAPRAKWVKVGFFNDLKDPKKANWLLMKRDKDFVWEATVDEDLVGYYYWFRIDGPDEHDSLFDPDFNVLDPYAKATVGREGPGIIVDLDAYRRPVRTFTPPQWQNLVVLEGHVRDFVQKLPGLPREGDRPLGFSDLAKYARRKDFYPKRLGVNAIELQPIQENDSRSYGEYHWGYMTANYFAPHSGYASDPTKGSQVEEFRELVDTLHEEGFAVILDVVYNHVGEPAHLMFVDKRYYFHMSAEGELTNWSGCGNDLRCEAPMAKRLIIESLKHLMEFYGVDGFRFDLADLVGKPVLKEVERELKKVRSDVILIAEPWSFRGHIGPELRDTGYASWNDGYREFLKGYVRCEASVDTARYFMQGSVGHYATWPAQTVNYVESHDDRVWIDDITENGNFDGTVPTQRDIARTRMMVAMLMMSVGMPMLHAGMDFLGSKNGVRNTYQDGPRNALNYDRALEYSACSKYFSEWIAFRLSEKGGILRHYNRAPEGFFHFLPAESGNAFACVYNASGEWGSRKLLFGANPGLGPVRIPLGEWGEKAWRQLADHERFLDPKDRAWANQPDKSLFLPRLACGLWELT